MNDESGEKRMYTQEELDEVKKEYGQDKKMNFIIEMLNDNSEEIERIRDKLYNGWHEEIMRNTMWRKGGLWFLGAIIISILGYVATLV